MSIIFYAVLTFVAYRACDAIFNNFMIKSGFDPDEQLTQAYIDSVYARISTTMGSRTLNAKLIQHRNQLHRQVMSTLTFFLKLFQSTLSSKLEQSINHRPTKYRWVEDRNQVGKNISEMQAAHNWDTSSSFTQVPNGRAAPGNPSRTQSNQPVSSTNENSYLLVNRSLPPPVPYKPGSMKQA